jgi:hypothetical protein
LAVLLYVQLAGNLDARTRGRNGPSLGTLGLSQFCLSLALDDVNVIGRYLDSLAGETFDDFLGLGVLRSLQKKPDGVSLLTVTLAQPPHMQLIAMYDADNADAAAWVKQAEAISAELWQKMGEGRKGAVQ